MPGKLIAVAYTLRTYGNQFSLGGICKQEYSINVRFYVKDGSHVRLVTSVLCLHYRPETVHCSTKDAYTSEINFLALQP